MCIARALVNNPTVLFADEPTGNLDSATSAVVEHILFGLHRDEGITLVVVTHDDDLAAKCDRRVELQDGVVIADERVTGTVSLGGGAHGVSLTLEAADLVTALDAEVADVTKPGAGSS